MFNQYCASCHLGQVAKAPSTTFLQMLPPDSVLAAQTTGIMQREAARVGWELPGH